MGGKTRKWQQRVAAEQAKTEAERDRRKKAKRLAVKLKAQNVSLKGKLSRLTEECRRLREAQRPQPSVVPTAAIPDGEHDGDGAGPLGRSAVRCEGEGGARAEGREATGGPRKHDAAHSQGAATRPAKRQRVGHDASSPRGDELGSLHCGVTV